MSKTVAQIFATNPTTVVADTDLYYLVQSPYTPGADAAITGASLKAAFGTGGSINPGLINQLGYYAAAGTTISGLATANNGVLITSGAGVPSISSTLPSAVQSNITALGTIATGIWTGTIIGGTYGGTGVNNGASTITIGGNVTFSGGFTFTGTITGNTAVTFPTSGTLATTSQIITSPLTTKGDLWGFSTVDDRLPVGTINGQILQVNSGATLGLSYSTATYPSTALNVARILRSDGTNYVDTTSTFADTYAASSVLYANGANNVAGLATANNGLLVTSNTGVPSILAGPGTTGNMLISNAAAAPSFTTYTVPTTVGATGSIVISDGTNKINSTSLWPNTVGSTGTILRSNGTSNAYTTSTFADTYGVSTILYASSANVVTGLATANSGVLVTSAGGVPSISSTLPAFTTSSITFSPTTGGIVGTTTNDNAAAGKVGEFVSSTVALASAVSNTTATDRDVTSISLTAGDWDVWGNVGFSIGGTCTAIVGWTSSTSATAPDTSLVARTINPAVGAWDFSVPYARYSLSGTTTIYLSSRAVFSTSTVTSFGGIFARRVR